MRSGNGLTPTCREVRSAPAGGSAAIMMCGEQLSMVGINPKIMHLCVTDRFQLGC